MNIRKNGINPQKLAFSGHNKKLDKSGYETHNFFYLYDKDKYKCEVELYNLKKDRNGNFSTGKIAAVIPMEDGKTEVNMNGMPKIVSDEGFAYRFKLTDKSTGEKSYAFDNGTVIGIFDDKKADNKFNVVLNNRATINKNGPMQLIMPDEYFPGYKMVDGKPSLDEALRGKALASVRTHANKLGGTFAGIIQRLPELEKEGIKRVVGTPFTKDTISSHLYWTENAYRVAPNLGTEEDFKVMQEEFCKHGINWIADAALVNEGFGGIHMSELLRKGDEGNAKNMFRAGERISLGILPDDCKFTRMKLINAPFVVTQSGTYESENPDYDSSKPTYVQFYDDRLASEEQKTSQHISRGTTYDNKNTDNVYDITKHDDAVYPFPVEVSPEELKRNVGKIFKIKGKVDFSDIDTIKASTNFTNFNIVNKAAAGGLEVWDGNVDIPKLNFYRADNDDSKFSNLPEYQKEKAMEKFEKGVLAARDYAVNSGKYWTKLVANTQLDYVSKLFASDNGNLSAKGCMEHINSLVKNGQLPASTLDVVDEEVVENVLSGDYHSRKIDDSEDLSTSEYILKEAMDVPLESIPVATNLLGVLTSPYIAKKASTDDEVGVSRFDLYSQNNPNLSAEYEAVYSEMDAVYSDDIGNILSEVVSGIDGVSDDGEVTSYGKFVLSEIVPDLTKYLFVKSLAPNSKVTVDKNGKFDFSKVDENAITIQSLGIPYSGKTLEEEAQIVVNKLKDGLAKISKEEIDDIKSKVKTRFENRDENSYRLAEMILDRTESGLGWRIDASKDIGSIDSVRAQVDSFDNVWDQVIDFWKSYNQAVLAENPHAYTTAEITNVSDLIDLRENNDKSQNKYISSGDAERKFLEETGITSIANYNYFFSFMPELFAPNSLENGGVHGNVSAEENAELLGKLDYGWEHAKEDNPGFLFDSPADGVENSYTFFGNHDKPRPLHGLVLNTNLFNFNFKSLGENSVQSAINAVKESIPDWAWKRVFVGNDGDDKLPERFVQEGKKFFESLKADGTGNDIKENINLIIDCIERIGKEYFESIGRTSGKDYLVTNAPDWRRDSLSSLEYYDIAADVLGKSIKEIDFDTEVNSMAIAMGQRLNDAFSKVLKEDPDLNNEMKKSVAELASGKHKGKDFDAAAFGAKPFDIAIRTVLDETEYRIGKIDEAKRKDIEAAVLKDLLVPAYDRYLSMYKLLSVLPGSPTDFAGDRVGVSGYETKCKNYYQQNRNVINWEWLTDERYSFIKENYDKINDISNLRSKKELSALNNGATITVPLSVPERNPKTGKIVSGKTTEKQVQSMIRYNDSGSVVISFHDTTGASAPLAEGMKRTDRVISNDNKRLYLLKDIVVKEEDKDTDNDKRTVKRGLKQGLKVGDVFYNAKFIDDIKDKEQYVVSYDEAKKEYYLEKKVKVNGVYQTKDIVIAPDDLNTLLLYKA